MLLRHSLCVRMSVCMCGGHMAVCIPAPLPSASRGNGGEDGSGYISLFLSLYLCWGVCVVCVCVCVCVCVFVHTCLHVYKKTAIRSNKIAGDGHCIKPIIEGSHYAPDDTVRKLSL